MLRASEAQDQTDKTDKVNEKEALDIGLLCAGLSAKLRHFTFRTLGYDKRYDVDTFYRNIPDVNPIYARTIEHQIEVAVHAQKGVFPYELLRSKAPNQSPAEWEYQCGIYEPYTRSSWGRALNKTKIIANQQNYSITGWDPEQKKYFYEDYPAYHSLEAYFFDIVREDKINFPNRLLVIEPRYIPTKQLADGTEVADQSVPIEPVCRIVEEKDIMHYAENHVTVIRRGDRDFGGVFYPSFRVYDKTAIYTCDVSEVTDKAVIYTLSLVYTHDWGYVPCRKLGGKPSVIDGEVFYESWFAEAIPDLNSALRLSSNLDMANYANIFPVRVTREPECKHMNEHGSFCVGGQIWNPAHPEGPRKDTCPACRGTGRGSHHSPTSGYAIPDSSSMDGKAYIPIDQVVTFVSPPISAIDSLIKQIAGKKDSAFSFMYRTSETALNTEEGVQMVQEENQSFYLQFSNELFDLLAFAIEGMGQYRYQSAFKMPTVSKPTVFSFRTPEDITKEITEAFNSKMPPAYIETLMVEASQTRFNSNPEAVRFILDSLAINQFWAYTDTELIAFRNQTLTSVDFIVKQRITSLLLRAYDEHEDFGDKTPEEKTAIVRGYAEEIQRSMPAAPSMAPAADSLV